LEKLPVQYKWKAVTPCTLNGTHLCLCTCRHACWHELADDLLGEPGKGVTQTPDLRPSSSLQEEECKKIDSVCSVLCTLYSTLIYVCICITFFLYCYRPNHYNRRIYKWHCSTVGEQAGFCMQALDPALIQMPT